MYKTNVQGAVICHQQITASEHLIRGHNNQSVASFWRDEVEANHPCWLRDERRRFYIAATIQRTLSDQLEKKKQDRTTRKFRSLYSKGACRRVSPLNPTDGPYQHSELQGRFIETSISQIAKCTESVSEYNNELRDIVEEVAPEIATHRPLTEQLSCAPDLQITGPQKPTPEAVAIETFDLD